MTRSYTTTTSFKKARSSRGLSLTELLVASMLIGIVMTGVMGFNFAIQSIEQTSDVDAQATISAASIASFIRKDAMLATGDINSLGIQAYNIGTPDFASICFRHDTPGSPLDYSDDDWVCYFHEADFILRRCEIPDGTGGPVEGNGNACILASQCCPPGSTEFEMETLDANQYNPTIGQVFATLGASGSQVIIDIHTVAGNVAGGPLDFSQVNFQTIVNPPMHSSN